MILHVSKIFGVLLFLTSSRSKIVLGLTSTSSPGKTATPAAKPSSMTFQYQVEQKLEKLVDNAGGIRSCETGPTQYGRGLVATKDLKPGEEVLRIPLSICSLRTEAEEGDDDDSWTGRLAMQMLQLDKTKSPYRAALPIPPSVPSRGDWPRTILSEFQNPAFLEMIESEEDWRYQQWENLSGNYSERQEFLDCLDLVCSRTIRTGNAFQLVPLLDMANHASRPQGGGYYKKKISGESEYISLFVGERGVRQGGEVTLDYGERSNEDWLIHYGFLPNRNAAETVELPESRHLISWDSVRDDAVSDDVRQECWKLLESYDTTLEEDLRMMQENSIRDFRLQFALDYRVSRKSLLSAVAGNQKIHDSSPSLSYSSSFGLVEG